MLHIQLNRFLGQHDCLSKEQKIELSQQLWGHYLRTKSLNVGLLATDFRYSFILSFFFFLPTNFLSFETISLLDRPNDGYALLAAHLLIDTWNNDPVVLDKCLLLLETALANSPANYHLKLLVTRVYTLAGITTLYQLNQ